MRVSVVIPAFNIESCIGRALESVAKQSSSADEVVVVDDGSTDRTVEIATRLGARVEKQANQGPGAARNRAVRVATGDWIAFLDGDDFWEPEKILNLRKAAELLPNAVLIANDDFEGPETGPWRKRDLHTRLDPTRPSFPQLYRGNFLATSSVAVRRDAFLKVGGMNEKFLSAQDFDLWLRLVELGPIHVIPKPLSYYVIRPGSISHNVPRRLLFSLQIADKYADRVSKRLYLYRIALCYYEAATAHYRHRKPFKALAMCAAMPFAVLRRIFSGRTAG